LLYGKKPSIHNRFNPMKASRLFAFFLVSICWLWTMVFWIGTLFVPLGFIVVQLQPGESGWYSLFFDPILLETVRFTVWQALWSTGISGGIGLGLGLYLGQMRFGKAAILSRFLLSLPYGVPTVVASVAWVSWLGRSGIFAQLGWNLDLAYSPWAVILAHVFFNVPLVALLVAQARERVVGEELEIAQTLGSGFFSQLRWVIWPRIRWAFLSACSQVFVLCTMSFILVLILGGGPPVQTLETEIYSRLRLGSFDLAGASVVAIWELIITLLPWLLVLWLQGRQRQIGSERVTRIKTIQMSWIAKMGVVFIGLFWIIPYLVIFTPRSFHFLFDSSWRTQLMKPIWVSFQIAGLTAAIAVTTALSASFSLRTLRKTRPGLHRIVNSLLALPGGVSILVLSLGLWFAYGRWVDPFDGSLILIAVLQAALFVPLAVKIFWPLTESERTSELEVARLLGASDFRAFFLVEWPRWRGPLLTAWTTVMGASLGEVGAVSLFYSENRIPLPLFISRWMSQYRFEEAQLVGGILFLMSSFAIVVSFYLLPRSKGESSYEFIP
jgi:thiamine transport system permease protein